MRFIPVTYSTTKKDKKKKKRRKMSYHNGKFLWSRNVSLLTGKGAAAEDCSSRQDNQLSIDWNGCGFYRREAVMDHSEESQHDPQITSRHSIKNRESLCQSWEAEGKGEMALFDLQPVAFWSLKTTHFIADTEPSRKGFKHVPFGYRLAPTSPHTKKMRNVMITSYNSGENTLKRFWSDHCESDTG